jgi:hypothetical protein
MTISDIKISTPSIAHINRLFYARTTSSILSALLLSTPIILIFLHQVSNCVSSSFFGISLLAIITSYSYDHALKIYDGTYDNCILALFVDHIPQWSFVVVVVDGSIILVVVAACEYFPEIAPGFLIELCPIPLSSSGSCNNIHT